MLKVLDLRLPQALLDFPMWLLLLHVELDLEESGIVDGELGRDVQEEKGQDEKQSGRGHGCC